MTSLLHGLPDLPLLCGYRGTVGPLPFCDPSSDAHIRKANTLIHDCGVVFYSQLSTRASTTSGHPLAGARQGLPTLTPRLPRLFGDHDNASSREVAVRCTGTGPSARHVRTRTSPLRPWGKARRARSSRLFGHPPASRAEAQHVQPHLGRQQRQWRRSDAAATASAPPLAASLTAALRRRARRAPPGAAAVGVLSTRILG